MKNNLKIILILFIKMSKEPLELISFNVLLTHSPYEIVNMFPILDKINELKNYRIKLDDDIILNIHKKTYNSLEEIIENASYIFYNFEEFIDIYDLNSYYPNINLLEYNRNISKYKIKFFREITLLLSSLPYELTRKTKTFYQMEMIVIKKFI